MQLKVILNSAFVSATFALGVVGDGGAQHDDLGLARRLVTSSELRNTINSHNLLKHANSFQAFSELSGGTRAFGSKAHNATVHYIKTLLDATNYYDTTLQSFVYSYSDGHSTFYANDQTYEAEWLTYGPAGNVTAPLVLVGDLGCNATDFPSSVVGNIALIKRGTCDFGLKVALAGAAGAKGAIIYNNVDGPLDGGGSLAQPSRSDVGPYVPVSILSGLDGSALVTAISSGEEVVGTLVVDAVNEDRITSNVIATSKKGDRENIVFSGGHTDSVPAGPGINDDGSGTIAILEIALQLAKWDVKNAVRFGFWTAEEFGLVGSDHYVSSLSQEEVSKVALYLNFDMIASPNFGYFIYDGDGDTFNISGPAGSDRIEKLFETYFASMNLKTEPTAFNGRSDYGPFLDVGVPSGGLFTGAEEIKTDAQVKLWGGQSGVAFDSCYHKACDDITNLNVKVWVENAKAIAHSIATYARSLDGIPRRLAKTEMRKRVQSRTYQRRYQSCGHERMAL